MLELYDGVFSDGFWQTRKTVSVLIPPIDVAIVLKRLNEPTVHRSLLHKKRETSHYGQRCRRLGEIFGDGLLRVKPNSQQY